MSSVPTRPRPSWRGRFSLRGPPRAGRQTARVTPRTRELAAGVFGGDDAAEATAALGSFSEEFGERVCVAAIKSSRGTMDGLRDAIEQGRADYGDLPMAAGFGRDVTAHERWDPGRLG